jgi:hypothetical protein
VLRVVATAMSQWQSRVPTSSSDQQVNHSATALLARILRGAGLGASSVDRLGVGRSRRSSPRSGKPATWQRATAEFREMRTL